MGDLELSLDDIIKKKLRKNNVSRNRNSSVVRNRRLQDQGNRSMKNVSNKTFPKLRGGVIKNIRGPNVQMNAGDARLNIIKKQREKISDARDKLGQFAKHTDARLRLMRLREQRTIRGNILRGAIPEEQILQRTIHPNIPFEDELMDYTGEMSYMARNYIDRPIPDADVFNYQFRNRQDFPLIYRTVENNVPLGRLFNQNQNPYSWKNPNLTQIDNIPDIPAKRIDEKIFPYTPYKNEDSPMWDYDDVPIVVTKRVKPVETVGILKKSMVESYHEREDYKLAKESLPGGKSKGLAKTLSERFCQDWNPSALKMNLLKAKLEASETSKDPNDKDEEPLGHRIVVSNLVPSVTHEDVRELFEDIGELISSKVVRPGTAEVVYKLHKDAVKAVDVYHNRQLDGQPMKCLLVNNRSLPVMSKVLKLPEKKSGKGLVELDMTAFRKALHKKSTL